MTDEMMSLRALIEKAPDADLLREMIGFAAQRLMELEVGELTGAAYGEKSAERLGAAQRLSRSGLGDPGRHGRAPDPQAPEEAATSRASSSRGAWPRRRSPP